MERAETFPRLILHCALGIETSMMTEKLRSRELPHFASQSSYYAAMASGNQARAYARIAFEKFHLSVGSCTTSVSAFGLSRKEAACDNLWQLRVSSNCSGMISRLLCMRVT